ncbi:MAG: hypothetical protein WD397_02585 [Wenzhouxiangellaceae bacterium]
MIGRVAGALALAAMAPTLLAQTLNCADISLVAPIPDVRFERDVLPILEDDFLQCTSCHGSSGNLALDQGVATHDNLFCADTQGSVPQPAGKRVVPGAPLESWLYLRVACDDPEDISFHMPRGGALLTSRELRIIHDWIDQGALPADAIFISSFDGRGECP